MRERNWLIGIVLVALLLRLGWGMTRTTDRKELATLPDQFEYLQLGENILNERSLHFYDPRFADEVYAYRMPGYPAVVALCGANLRVVRGVQALLDTSLVIACFLMGRHWFGPRGGLIAGALIALNPFLIYFSGLILSETLCGAMIGWGMWLLVQKRWGWMGAVLIVLSVMVRPSGVGLALVLGWSAAVVMDDPATLRWVGLRVLVMSLIILAPWALRNKSVVKEWIWTTTNGGITLYDGFNPNADGSSNQSFTQSMKFLSRMTEVERDQYFNSEAKRYIRTHPVRSIELGFWKIARTWSPVPLSKDFSKPAYMAAGLIYSIPLYTLIVLAVLKGQARRAIKVFLLMPALYFTVLHACSVGSLRYRMPAEAPMAVLAGLGAVSVMRPRPE